MPFTVVCICGSTRYKEAILQKAQQLTLSGHVVLAPFVFGHADEIELDDELKDRLDLQHLQMIDMSEVVYVVNPGGDIGRGKDSSTRKEIAYAFLQGKRIASLYPIDFASIETTVTRDCPLCKKTGKPVSFTLDQMINYGKGALIQNAFPNLTQDEREILKTGICNDCFLKMGEKTDFLEMEVETEEKLEAILEEK